jgi:hypothetical protein
MDRRLEQLVTMCENKTRGGSTVTKVPLRIQNSEFPAVSFLLQFTTLSVVRAMLGNDE